MNNAQLYRYMLAFFEERGYDVYVRDDSILGFPSYRVIVPGYSELFTDGITRMKEKKSHASAGVILRDLGNATENQWHTLHTYLKYKEHFALENTLSFTMGLPLSISPLWDRLVYVLLCVVCDIHFQDYQAAHNRLGNALRQFPSETDTLSCAAEYVRQLAAGISSKEAMDNLHLIYTDAQCWETAEYLLEERLPQTIDRLLSESWDCITQVNHAMLARKKAMRSRQSAQKQASGGTT